MEKFNRKAKKFGVLTLKLGNLLLSKKVSNPSIENPNGTTVLTYQKLAFISVFARTIDGRENSVL